MLSSRTLIVAALASGLVAVWWIYFDHQQPTNSVLPQASIDSGEITDKGSSDSSTVKRAIESVPSLEVLEDAADARTVEKSALGGAGLNWERYPGTLNAQVEQALSSQNGEMAMDLAAKLQECALNARVMAVQGSTGGGASRGALLDGIRAESLREYQRQLSSCQTVAGDLEAVRNRLLEVAVEKNVFGAAALAFSSGVRGIGVVGQVAQDAYQGDLVSLFHLAAYRANMFGISENSQQAARFALKVGSEDPEVGQRIRPYLEQAQVLAMQYGGRPEEFNFASMDMAAKKEGLRIGAILVARLRR